MKHKIIYYSLVHGVNPDLALFIAEKESNFDEKNIGDTDIICKRTGKAVYARGLYQITRCYHPEVSDLDAFDEDFSILWSIPKMKDMKQCKKEWTTCRLYIEKNRAENYSLANTS